MCKKFCYFPLQGLPKMFDFYNKFIFLIINVNNFISIIIVDWYHF